MAEVAARARISKASLYREHPSKDALYAAVVSGWAAAGRDAMRPALEILVEGTNINADLTAFAHTLCSAVLSPEVLGMRRRFVHWIIPRDCRSRTHSRPLIGSRGSR